MLLLPAGLKRMPYSGMTVDEAIKKAKAWWEDRGRELTTHLVGERPKVIAGLYDQAETGIMSGLPWDKLSVRERSKVIMVWHAQYCIDQGLVKQDDRTGKWVKV